MSDRIILRIGNVNKEEFDQLNTAMSALSESRFREFNISPLKDSNYVVSISPLDGQTIRDTLDALTRILEPGRIEYAAVAS